MDEDANPAVAHRRTRTLCVLFFVSGFPALVYQLAWERALFRIFGVNVESVTIVVTAFMLGLGLGSLLGGSLSRRRIPLLPLVAAIELLTAAFGAVSLRIFDRAEVLVLRAPLPVAAAIALALVIVPTLLMGATLPVLVGHLVRRTANVGGSVGLLYFANTLGAGAACLVAAIALFPFLGLQASIHAAVGINVAVALGALGAHVRGGSAPPSTVQRRPVPVEPPLRLAVAMALGCLGGFVSLSYEIFFFRTISFATGGNASAFAVTLSAFLFGLASGSRLAGRTCRDGPDAAKRHALRSIAAANVAGWAFLPVAGRSAGLGLGALVLSLVIVYLVASRWGVLLPTLAHLAAAADRDAGMRTAQIVLANILGSAAGSIVTGFVLMDRLTLVRIEAALVITGSTCAVLLNAALPAPSGRKVVRAAWALALCALGVVSLPRLTPHLLERLMWKRAFDRNAPFAHVVENRSGIIAVDTAGAVYGHGMYDGRFNVDLVHDTNGIVRAYALSLFHAAPRDVLVIGLSSGSWAQVLAANPEVASVTIVEINPGYLSLVSQNPAVASLLRNPKVAIHVGDGRRWLRMHRDRRFDAVVSNTTYYFRANASALLSTQFLDLVRAHLKPGGIFQYNTTGSARVQRTGCLAFPHGARFSNQLVVSNAPLDLDFRRWRRTLEAYRIDGRPVLDPARPEDRRALEGLLSLESDAEAGRPDKPIERCPEILAHTSDAAVVTDDNMGSEWRFIYGVE